MVRDPGGLHYVVSDDEISEKYTSRTVVKTGVPQKEAMRVAGDLNVVARVMST